MKLSIYIVTLLSCVVMALPLHAQDLHNSNEIFAECGNEQRDDTVSEESYYMEKQEMIKGHSFYIHLGISILTLIGLAFLLFITVKKKLNMKSENNNSEEICDKRDNELQSIRTQLQQIQELLFKQAELLNQFATQIGNQQIANSNMLQTQESDVISGTRQSAQQSSMINVCNFQQTALDPVSEKTFVATASTVDNKVLLKVVEDLYANQAAFEIRVKGDTGTYRFNPIATKTLLNYADTKIKPYCDITIDSGKVPSRIDTSADGVIQRHEDDWVVTKMAQIHIS